MTFTPSTIVAPRWRAPLASAMAMLAGSHWPSSGRCTAPTTSEMLRCGYISLTSLRRNLAHVDVEGAGQRGLAVDLVLALLGQRHRDRADLPHAGADAGLGLQLDVEVGRIFRQPRHVLRAAQLADQAGRMPGGAAGQLLALEQHDVGPAELGQVIGDRTAGDAAADDDGACFGGNGFWAGWSCGLAPIGGSEAAQARGRFLQALASGWHRLMRMWPAAASPKLEPGMTATFSASSKRPGEFLVVGLDGADVEHDIHAAFRAAHGDVVHAAHGVEEHGAARRRSVRRSPSRRSRSPAPRPPRARRNRSGRRW